MSIKLILLSFRMSTVHIEDTSDQLLLEENFLVDIKFDSDLWYFVV